MEAKVSQNDLKELRRVFDFLADFAPKNKLRRELQPKLERRAKIAMFLRNPESVKMVDETGAELPMAVVTLEDKRLEDECRELAARVETITSKGDDVKRIHPRDLLTALEFLGKPTNKKEVEDMLWEVDEDIDGSVCYSEFQLMFRRNIADKSGLEPCQLFSVVQFLMYDREFTGHVSLDQTMNMLYNRYGKDRLEAEMKVRGRAGCVCARAPPWAAPPPCASSPTLTHAHTHTPTPLSPSLAQALFGDSIAGDGNAKLSFLDYLKAVKARSQHLAAVAAQEMAAKYSGAPGSKRK
jgi:hypothetical protein